MTVVTSHLVRAQRVTPNASQTRSKAPGQVGPRFWCGDVTDFPLFAQEGHGAYVVDDRGRQYLDCAGANAAVPLGYGYAGVVREVQAAVEQGSLLSLPHVLEAEVSETFLRTCAPWAQQVRWLRTGSEATHAALKIARAATGRRTVLIGDWAYHGWHEWCASASQESVVRYPHGFAPLEAFGASGPIAAVFYEPHRWERPARSWLRDLRAWCTEHGALLVFDEMVYGLRWARGGAAEYYGIVPDLACFGKALGNGVPVACVCGPEPFMRHATPEVSGTYGGDAIGLSAARAVLQAHAERDVIEELWGNGRATWEAFADFAPKEARLEGTYVHWRLAMPTPEQLDLALAEAARLGVLVHRSANNASAAMSPAEARFAGKVLGNAAEFAMQVRP